MSFKARIELRTSFELEAEDNKASANKGDEGTVRGVTGLCGTTGSGAGELNTELEGEESSDMSDEAGVSRGADGDAGG